MARRRITLALGAILLLAACGPKPPLSVTMAQFPSNLVIGGNDQQVINPQALPPQGPQAIFRIPNPPPVEAPANPLPRLPTIQFPPVGSCGTSALTKVSAAALQNSPEPPVEATYQYRLSGVFDADGHKGPYPATATRTVGKPTIIASTKQGGKEFTYTVTEQKEGNLHTSWGYHVIAPTPASGPIDFGQHNAGQVPDDPGGIYLNSMSSNDPSSLFGGQGVAGRDFTVTFNPGIKLAPFNLRETKTWSTSGNDPTTQSSFALDGVVIQRSLVDACGKVLEAWEVHMQGTLSSAAHRNASVDLTFELGTEYGGFSLGEAIIESGSDHGLRDYLNEVTSISEEAKLPPALGGI